MPKGDEKLDRKTVDFILSHEDLEIQDSTLVRAHAADPEAVPLERLEISPRVMDLIRQSAEHAGRRAGREAATSILIPERPQPEPEASAPSDPFAALLAEFQGGNSSEGRTELVMRLYWQTKAAGSATALEYQDEWSLTPSDVHDADLGLERRVAEWAAANDRWGLYEWRVKAWIGGVVRHETSKRVRVSAPAGYQAPPETARRAELDQRRTPAEELENALSLMERVSKAMGGGGEGKLDGTTLALAKESAAATARMEAEARHRDELRKLEKEHRTDLIEAEAKGHARGLLEGRRAAEDEYRPKVWELEKKLESGRDPSILDQAVAYAGGPEVVQSFVKALLTNSERKAAPTAPPPQQHPVLPSASQPAPQAPLPLPEPTRAEWRAALDETEAALSLIEESQDTSPSTVQAKTALTAFRDAGLANGPLGQWWMAWRQGYQKAVHDVLAALDPEPEPEPEPTMDMDGLKSLLHLRLDEGATDDVILAELNAQVPEDTRASWKKLVAWVPEATAAAMIADGRPDLEPRIGQLLKAFLGA